MKTISLMAMNMFSRPKYQILVSFVCSLLILICIFAPNSMASGLADVPLTKATPESQGLDGIKLEEAFVKIKNKDYGNIHSLLITRNNYLVLEKYFSMYEQDNIHPVYSVTKSITSALVGIAIEQGKINSLQTKLLDFFPEYNEVDNVDLRKKSITLENLITMTAGFKWDELSIPYTNPLNDIRKFAASPDPIKYMLDLPMGDSPGTFEYNSGCTVLIGGILKNACGQSAKEYADENLFKPLDINNYFWKTFSNGTINTGWGLLMRPIDMARFGILFLNNGNWRGKQIIPKKWCRISTAEHLKSSKLIGNYLWKFSYGYQWWKFLNDDPTVSELTLNDLYYALGYGSNYILVIPHLKMVVVSTAENSIKTRHFNNLIRDYIFPAVMD